MLKLASDGLRRREFLDNAGSDETGFLTPLIGVVQTQKTLSEELLDAFNGRWQQAIDPVFAEFSY